MDEAKAVLDETMDYCMDKNITDWEDQIRDQRIP